MSHNQRDFKKKGKKDKVYKLNKTLYGLRQAPRAWNNKLNKILMELQFERCSKEPSVYRKEVCGNLLIIAVYVDDLFVTGTNLNLIDEFKKEMASKFEMSDLGRLTYYLDILEEVGMSDCNLVNTLMYSGLKLSKAEDEEEIDATSYRKNVGCLRYLLHTRPDLSYYVGVLSRYMQSPKFLMELR